MHFDVLLLWVNPQDTTYGDYRNSRMDILILLWKTLRIEECGYEIFIFLVLKNNMLFGTNIYFFQSYRFKSVFSVVLRYRMINVNKNVNK